MKNLSYMLEEILIAFHITVGDNLEKINNKKKILYKINFLTVENLKQKFNRVVTLFLKIS